MTYTYKPSFGFRRTRKHRRSGQRARRPRRFPGRLLALLGGAIVLALIGWYVVIPYPWTLRTEQPERTAVMEQRLSEATETGLPLEIQQTWVPLAQISPELVRAVIVAEDYRFRHHEGVDWVSLAEEVAWSGNDEFSWSSASDLGALADALGYAWTHRDELRGRSTLTQQLAKNLYFGTERSLARKGLELVVAGRLERRLGKDRILELYLNTAEWGPGIFGAEAAAHAYFDRSASSLTLEQAATLAATLPHPLTSNPEVSPSRMLWRRDLLLDRLDPDRDLTPEPIRSREPTFEVAQGLTRIQPAEVQALDPLSVP
jgi:monofunctional biosynthetic peptidoglycan transglycosylase